MAPGPRGHACLFGEEMRHPACGGEPAFFRNLGYGLFCRKEHLLRGLKPCGQYRVLHGLAVNVSKPEPQERLRHANMSRHIFDGDAIVVMAFDERERFAYQVARRRDCPR